MPWLESNRLFLVLELLLHWPASIGQDGLQAEYVFKQELQSFLAPNRRDT